MMVSQNQSLYLLNVNIEMHYVDAFLLLPFILSFFGCFACPSAALEWA